MSDFLRFERQGAVGIITLQHPKSHNALTDQAQFDAIAALCDEINQDESIGAVVLTGEGKSFCAGGNVKDMKAGSGIFAGNAYQLRDRYRRGIQGIPLAVYHLEVPTIAAVNGNAIGAGCDLALMCDIRIASTRARFAESFVKLGIVPGDGGAWFLPRALNNLSRAHELAFTGETIDADTALSDGLVSRVVEADHLMSAALDVAERITANATPAVRLTKKLLREAEHVRLEQLLELSASYQALAHHTPEHRAIMDRL